MDKEYQLHISITKALSPSEAPLKVKHARSVIIATHRSKSAKPFWAVITRQPIMEHRFTAWKFCNLLHKVLREGHESAVKQSQTHKTLILEVGKMWGHLQDGVGKCIEAYTRLLVNKLEFHQKNANIPGSLALDFNEFARTVGDDLNLYFQLCVEVFDYLEHILQVQGQIFLAINSYRLSSMTPQGQCRLAPLITLIQDSNPLYDICVRIMFRLHDGLPHDVLMGHRNRFNEIFKKLKAFYESVRPLQYFSDVIQLPHLPENAPNFSSELDLGNYTAPVMVLQQEPEPEPEPTIESLVDLANAADNNAQAENALDEKELIIRQLTEELSEKQMALEHYANLAHQINNYQLKNESLEREMAKARDMLESTLHAKDNLEQKLGEMSHTMEQKLIKMSTLEEEVKQSDEKVKQVDEKFDKIKTMYTKLREEHIGLLRMRNEDSKQLAAEKKEIEKLKEEIENLNEKLCKSDKTEELNTSLKTKSLEYEEALANKENFIDNLNSELAQIKEQLQKSQEEHLILLHQFETQKSKLEEDSQHLVNEKQDNQQLILEIQGLKGKLEHQVSKTDEIDTSLKTKSQQYEETIANKDVNIEQLNSELSQHKEQLEKSQLEHTNLIKQYEEQMKTHLAESELLKQTAEKDSQTKQQKIQELLHIQTNNEAALQKLELQLNSINTEKQNLHLELKTVHEQVEQLQKSQTEAHLATDTIIASVIKTIKHSLSTDFTYKVFEANVVLQQAETNIDTISLHLQNILQAFKLHIGNNTRLTGDFVKSSIELISTLRTLHEYITLVAENTTDMENGQVLRSLGHETRDSFIILFQMLLDNTKDVDELQKHCQQEIDVKLLELKKLLLLMSNSFTENLNIADLLQQELKDMDKMIEDAAQKMLEIQQNSKSKNEGIKLEVNEKILESCTNLMQCIINLIKKSRDLQNEIVVRGKGKSTEKDFYKRNSQWTEGLISASKSVAKGANYLVDAANKAIVLESNECFEIIVAAQEIAASTAQLVIASKVKANKDSQKLMDLTKASRDVSLATGSVVATVKDGCNKLEYKNEIDMTKLTTSQKKAMEMEMHIKVLQLEQALDNERQSLMSFRKKFYQSSEDD
ncbi:huntingtin-interacting protein 1 [Calliphora vicina]|uniref:huntingtin-interacting protein 1 n=1 Tax=Calliphora vicina TaxID=7373 RepID=UPI00325BA2D2